MTDIQKPEAVIYCRVAQTKHATPGYGIASQEARCRKTAQDMGCNVVAVFSECASGCDPYRPGIKALLEHAWVNPGVAVIVDDLHRLARDTRLFIDIRDILRDAGARLVTPTPVLSDDTESQFLEQVLISAAQHLNDEDGT